MAQVIRQNSDPNIIASCLEIHGDLVIPGDFVIETHTPFRLDIPFIEKKIKDIKGLCENAMKSPQKIPMKGHRPLQPPPLRQPSRSAPWRGAKPAGWVKNPWGFGCGSKWKT